MLSKIYIASPVQYQEILHQHGVDLERPDADSRLIEVDPEKTLISIDQIRNAKQFTFTKPITMPLKKIVIKEADLMTEEAQNSLLKLLEEPPEYVEIIILTSQPDLLLETIRSRCEIRQRNPIQIQLSEDDHAKLQAFYKTLKTAKAGEKIQLVEGMNTREKAGNLCRIHQQYLRLVLLKKPHPDTSYCLHLWMQAARRIAHNTNSLLTLEDTVLRLKTDGLD